MIRGHVTSSTNEGVTELESVSSFEGLNSIMGCDCLLS